MQSAAQILHNVKRIAREHFAWPGGYELYAVANDGGVLCFNCCRSEFPQIARSTISKARDGWQCIGYSSMAETEEPITCDHCNREIA